MMYCRVRKFSKLQSRGDTIVEVLISLAIISLVLVAAYAIANQSLRGLQNTQEHNEALSIARAQVEYLRQNEGLDSTSKGCFDINQAAADRGGDGCKFEANGSSPCQGSEPCYTVDITKNSSDAYQVSVTWDGLVSSRGLVTLWYRPVVVATGATPGPVPAGSGEAVIDPGGCGFGAHPACPPIAPAGGSYHYDRVFHNVSNNDMSHVTGCSWDWHDGTPVETFAANDPVCAFDGWRGHSFYPATPLPPYPAACYGVPGAMAYRYTYSATLTITFDNIAPKDKTSTNWLPDCY